METQVKKKHLLSKKKFTIMLLTALVCLLLGSMVGYKGFNNSSDNISKDTIVSDNSVKTIKAKDSKSAELTSTQKELINNSSVSSTKKLDPIGKKYIAEHINTKYAKLDKLDLTNTMVVRHLLVDKTGLSDNETIDNFWSRDDAHEYFYTQIVTDVAVYETDDDSDYYVAYINTMKNDDSASVYDVEFAINNNEGQTVDGCIYDKDSGLAYIPKSLYLYKNKDTGKKEIVVNRIQTQLLQAMSVKESNVKSDVNYAEFNNLNSIKNGEADVEGFKFLTKVSTDKNLAKDDIMLSVNGLPTTDFEYNSNTGVITLSKSSLGISTVSVNVDEKASAKAAIKNIFSLTNVSAASSINDMLCAGTVTVPSGVGSGWHSDSTQLGVGYNGNWNQSSYPVYGLNNYDDNLRSYLHSGGVSWGYGNLVQMNSGMYFGVYLGVGNFTNGTSSSFWDYGTENASASYVPEGNWLKLQCAHVASPIGNRPQGNADGWYINNVCTRVLDKSNDYIVVSFVTQKKNTQTGCGIAKFKIRNPPSVSHTLNYNANGGTANEVAAENNPNGYKIIDTSDYFIQYNVDQNKYLHASGANNYGPNSVIWNSYSFSAPQTIWTFERYKDTPYYYIFNRMSGKALNLSGDGDSVTDTLDLYRQLSADDSQYQDFLWYLIDEGDGWISIVNKKTNKAIDCYGSGTDNGSSVNTYTVNHTGAQKWKLHEANTSKGYVSRKKENGLSVYVNSAIPHKKGYTFKYWCGGNAQTLSKVVETGDSSMPRYWIAPVYNSQTGKRETDRWEVLVYAPTAAYVQAPNWTQMNGQDDLDWTGLGSGSWERGGQSFNFGGQLTVRNSQISNYIIHLYAKNSSDGVITSFDTSFKETEFYGAFYSPGDNYTYDTNIDETLYAIYSPNSYKIVYDANGGKGTMNDQTVTYDQKYSVKANSFTYSGHKFIGWNTQPDGRGDDWTDRIGKEKTWNYENDVTLYAIWKGDSYDVKFMPNGGEGTMSKQKFDVGESKKLSDKQFTRTGYEFLKWTTESNGSGNSYENKETVKDISSAGTTLPLYAQWTPIEYIIRYNGNGNTSGSTASSSHTYDQAKSLTKNGFKKTGYTFTGWTTEEDGSGDHYSDIESVINLTTKNNDVIDLYAQWTPNEYTVVYHPVAPTYSQSTVTGTMENTNCTYGLNYNFRKNTFGLNNHKFIGWSTRKGTANNELTKKDIVYQDKQPFKNLSSANGAVINLYPVWDEAPTIKTKYRKFLKNKDVDKNKLLKYVTSDDREDGDLTNKVVIKQIKYSDRVDTSPTKLDTSVVTDDIIVTVTVTDSQGNTTEQVFYVSIYEEAPDITEPAQESEIRFISRTQAEKRYYLKDTSNWKTDAVLNQKIKDSFDSRNGGSEYEYDSSTKRWVKK